MRIKDFQRELRARKIDACILKDDDSMLRYLVGGEIEAEQAYLIVPAKKPAVLLTTGFEVPRFRKATKVKVAELNKKSLKRAISGFKTIGLNYDGMSVSGAAIAKGKKKRNVAGILKSLRKEKTKEELKRMQKACKITDIILEECFRRFKRFKTEKDVKRFLVESAEDRGCALAFPPIVGSGKHGALPHYDGNDKLGKGFCVVDFGVKWKGYCSDVTRTVYIGEASQAEREMYEKVLEAQNVGIEKVREGVKASKVDEAVRKKMGKMSKYFIHGLGHQLGVDVHEGDMSLSPSSKGILEKNMVVTVEPGVYFPGKYGIRIEDDVVVGKNKAKVLSKATRKLQEL